MNQRFVKNSLEQYRPESQASAFSQSIRLTRLRVGLVFPSAPDEFPAKPECAAPLDRHKTFQFIPHHASSEPLVFRALSATYRVLLVIVFIQTLLFGGLLPSSFSDEPTQGAPKNVAQGKPCEFSHPPNYSHCQDADDASQVTDGKFTEGWFWTQKSTVGWGVLMRI